MSHITYPEAIVVGLLQGVSELFPVSSLGHSVLLPALIGGRWARDLNVSAAESPYLAFIVGLHVATAVALLIYFRRDWARIVRGFGTSIRYRRVERTEERLAWMIVLATIPVGVTGLLLEHTFRTVLGRPIPAAIFLTVNGAILYGAELLRRRAARLPALVPADGQVTADPVPAGSVAAGRVATAAVTAEAGTIEAGTAGAGTAGAGAVDVAAGGPDADLIAADERIVAGGWGRAVLIGASQILALLPGISRSGVTMATGLARGLSHEDSARFAFLLATPVILAAGVLKLPDLFGPLGAGITGQVLAGSVASGAGAYLAVRFLTRWFHTRTLTPFAVYCAVAGVASLIWLLAHR